MVADPLLVSVTSRTSHVVVALAGQSDFANGLQLRDALMAPMARGALRLIVDVSGLEFADSTGIDVLRTVRAAVRSRDGLLVLVDPRPVTAALLGRTGAAPALTVYDTVVAAAAAVPI